MMKLTTMWRVLATVGGDEWRCPIAEEILERWGYDPGSVHFVRASANFVAVFSQGGQRRFLRFSDSGERSREELLDEANLLTWLDGRGVPLARPVPSQQGLLVETVETALGTFHALVFAGLPGAHREVEELAPEEFRLWGEALGRLHAALGQYDGPPLAARQSWREHLDLASTYIAPDDRALQAEWEDLANWAAGLPSGGADYGLIHFDFESDNLCWHQGAIASLDYDDAAYSWYAADITYALSDLFAQGVGLDDSRVEAFVAGYAAHRPVNRDLLAQASRFWRLNEIYRYGRLCRAVDLPAGTHEPEWLVRLAAKLRGRAERVRRAAAERWGGQA